MDFIDLVNLRRSVRCYQDRPVEHGLLDQLAEALRLAPSASNQQPWRLVIVDEPSQRDAVAKACCSGMGAFNAFVMKAPVMAVLCRLKPRLLNQAAALAKTMDWTLIDIGIAAEHLCLQAAELGLGSCMLGWFDEKRIAHLLGLPAAVRVGLVVAIGWPADDPTKDPAGASSTLPAGMAGVYPQGVDSVFGRLIRGNMKKRKSLDLVRGWNHF
jgi:nitroreductase